MLATLTVALAVTAVTALPATAHAAAQGPRVDLAEAAASLPAVGAIPPGDLTGFNRKIAAKPTSLSPCNLAAKSLRANLHDNGAAIGIYATPASAPAKKVAQWVVSTRVFASGKAAHSAVARLGVLEGQCPKAARVTTAAGTMKISRTWSHRYVTGAWHGYHTVDVIVLPHGGGQLRHIAVYLQKGNALIQVDEIATVVGHNAAQQENRRLTVQWALEARVDQAATS